MSIEPTRVNLQTLQPTVPDSNKEITATNRKLPSSEIFSQSNDDIINALENTPSSRRGSRSRPSIMRFPQDIATGQYPHVMQFKIFWRWERKELRAARVEAEKKIQALKTFQDLYESGQFDEDAFNAMQQPDQDAAMQELFSEINSDPEMSKVVSSGGMAQFLKNDPTKARAFLEERVENYQNRIKTIESEKTTLDSDERMQVNSRLNTVLEGTSATEAAIKTGVLAGGLAGANTLLETGDWKAAGWDALKAGGTTALATGTAVALAKALQNAPSYDQMVSIYLPICTKIGNEDTFSYEDASGALVGGLLDGLNNTMDTLAQGSVAAAIYAANKKGQGGAVTALSGLVINPRLEKVFKAKDFRSFAFSWEMYPKNAEETEMIRNIIETFRYHANPSQDEELIGQSDSNARIILRAPAEFEVRFLSTQNNGNSYGFVENEYIPKIARMACTSITVDYTPNGVFSTFKNNAPTAMVFTLNFQEIETLTREAVDKGF